MIEYAEAISQICVSFKRKKQKTWIKSKHVTKLGGKDKRVCYIIFLYSVCLEYSV